MPYLIDGHNLIPKLGMRLDSLDDEMELIAVLQEYSRLEHKKQLEVYFDGAPATHAGTRKLGIVIAHFISLTSTADSAIHARLKKMGKSAKNWTVVSSDRQVQVEAQSAGAKILSSDEFAKKLIQARNSVPKPANEQPLSNREVDDWLELFKRGKNK